MSVTKFPRVNGEGLRVKGLSLDVLTSYRTLWSKSRTNALKRRARRDRCFKNEMNNEIIFHM